MKQVNLRIYRMILPLILGLFLSVGTYAQSITVKGHVKDALGGVIGASVVEKGNTTNGTITDLDGNFSLNVPKGSTLVVSFIGYKTQEVVAASSVVVTLQEDSELLDEVVVIGYGVARKNDLTGSVTAIKPDEMNKGLTTSAQDMMQGKIAGVSVVNNGGEPGGSATIRIRGGSSLNASNDPLIVIDGLAMDNYGVQGMSNPLALVNPADIESFTVLKDASATAIYGSRASNGVILITTKKGQSNSKPRISYNGNVSVSMVTDKLDVLNAKEFMKLVQNTYGYSDEEFLASAEYQALGYMNAQGEHLFADTDWQDEIYRTAVSTDHNITVSGGLKNMPYRVSLGYTNQQGILKTSSFERYTASVNLSPSLFDEHLKVNFNAKGMYSVTSYANTDAIGAATSMDPTKPVYGGTEFYDKNFGGYWEWPEAVDWKDSEWGYNINTLATANPVGMLNNRSDKGKSKVLMGNIELDYKIHGFEDLHLHVNGGMDVASGKSNKNYNRFDLDNYYYGRVGWNTQDTYNLSLNMYAQYMKDFGKAHHFDIMAGYEWQHFPQRDRLLLLWNLP